MKAGTVKRGFDELVATGLVNRVRDHVRPGFRGRGRAAEYELVHRTSAERKPGTIDRTGVFAVIDHGDEIEQGYIKIPSGGLLCLLRELSDSELELIWTLAFRNNPRDKFGAIQADATMKLSEARRLLPYMPPRTLNHAATSLLARNLLERVKASSGRSSMQVSPTGIVAVGLSSGRSQRDKHGWLIDGYPPVADKTDNIGQNGAKIL
jgi:hypothetical protein